MGKRRLDALLAERGLFPSRSRAAASVMAGEVRVGSGGRRAAKPGEIVDCRELLAVEGPAAFVSRGGIKLANALAGLELEVNGRCALGRARVGKGGVVRNAADRRDALVAVGRSALEAGSAVHGYQSSGLPGPKGNRETFIWLSDPAAAARGVERGSGSARALMPGTAPERADAQALEALEALAREVEP